MLKIATHTVVALSVSVIALASPASKMDTEAVAMVSEVYPSSATQPENLLRFYLYFSKPMKREETVAAIYLADEKGNKLEGVFLANRYSLWDPSNKRLTLLFDPGRVKTGLVAHNSMGRALKPGNHYQLIVSTAARDATGKPLKKKFCKPFQVSAEDKVIPDASKWTIQPPTQQSRKPLTVKLNGKMDHLSLAHRLRILDRQGNVIPGSIDIGNEEQQWIFTPNKPWEKITYQLAIDPQFEDIAGNRMSGLFDQPSLARESATQGKRTLLPFTPVAQ